VASENSPAIPVTFGDGNSKLKIVCDIEATN